MTPQEAADWMLARFQEKRFLYQEEAATQLLTLRDEALAHYDANGNACINKTVLAIFNKLTPHAVYEHGDKFWRDRLLSDQPGRQQ